MGRSTRPFPVDHAGCIGGRMNGLSLKRLRSRLNLLTPSAIGLQCWTGGSQRLGSPMPLHDKREMMRKGAVSGQMLACRTGLLPGIEHAMAYGWTADFWWSRIRL